MSLLRSVVNKNFARYLIGIALLNEGILMTVAKADYQNLYREPLKMFLSDYDPNYEVIIMALLTSFLLGGGLLSMANNKTGLQIALASLLSQILIINLPNMYNSTGGWDLVGLIIDFLKLVVGFIATMNLIERMPKKLCKGSTDDLREIR